MQSLSYIRDFFGKDKINYKHHKICEWAVNSIIAYADLHRDELPFYGKDFSQLLTKDEIVDYLYSKGVSLDYNQPATLEKLKRMKEDKLRLCYNSIQCTQNLVDVARVKGSDLDIDNREEDYLLTFSFPCQNLSLAGSMSNLKKKEEINEDNIYSIENRSNMLWQVVRIITECHSLGYEHMPTLMLLENVPQIHSKDNMEKFKDMISIFEKLGYSVWWDDLTATDFGIPQTRNRTFVVFILNGKNGETYRYDFPKPVPLKLRLKDMLEENVDEKYYLSEKTLKQIYNWNSYQNPLDSVMGNESVCPTITTRIAESQDGGINASMKVLSEDLEETTNIRDANKKPSFEEVYNRIKSSSYQQTSNRIQEKDVCDTLCARDWKDPKCVIEKGVNNKNLKETLENNDLDKIEDVGYVDAYNRNIITDGTAKTILTGVDYRNQDFLLIKNKTKKGFLEAEDGDGVDISSRMEHHRGTVQKGKAQTITCAGGENVGVVVKETNYSEKSLEKIVNNIVDENTVSGTLTATGMQSINHDGCQLVSLKRGYDVEVKEEKVDTDDIDYIGNYSKSNFNQTSIVGKNGIAPTVTENHGQVTAITEEVKPKVVAGIGEKKSNGGTQFYQQDRVYDENCAISITTSFNPNYQVGLRIRKLTPRECFRLQGLKDKSITQIMENQNNSSGYHLAGDSIVCYGVLTSIFCKLFGLDYKLMLDKEEWWKND